MTPHPEILIQLVQGVAELGACFKTPQWFQCAATGEKHKFFRFLHQGKDWLPEAERVYSKRVTSSWKGRDWDVECS